jgi:hypothetical protein
MIPIIPKKRALKFRTRALKHNISPTKDPIDTSILRLHAQRPGQSNKGKNKRIQPLDPEKTAPKHG